MEEYKVETEEWKITNDSEAEWLIDKNNEELVEIRAFKQRLSDKIQQLQEMLDKEKEKEERILETVNYYLRDYFSIVDDKLKKKTKTQEKYRLPSGDIIKKYSKPKYNRTEDLTKWVKDNKLNYLKIKEDVEWGELKKETELVGDKLIYKPTGEIIKGIDIEWSNETIEFKDKQNV